MQKIILPILTILILIINVSVAQVPLNTFIGQTTEAADAIPVIEIPIYPDVSTNLEEPLEGALVHDFKLFTLDGDSVQLSGVLNDGKPVLLIGCNYTCYVYRSKLDVINTMQSMYGDLINIYLVYTVEAHPVIDFSPYFGYENVGADNYAEGILYRQPLTYGERKDIVSDMLDNLVIDVPVLIDGPDNAFWMNYGTAPNPAWLIAPDGIVYDAQKWYNKEPENMYASIDELLGLVGTGTYTPEGVFEAEEEGEEIYYGTVENTIAAHITFTNTSDDDVLIDFVRESVDVPAGWFTSLCTDLCFSPSIDSTSVFLSPGQTEEVRLDFFTDNIPAQGTVVLSCTNHYDPTNVYTFTIKAESIAATNINISNAPIVTVVSPNPVSSGAMLSLGHDVINGSVVQIFTTAGSLVYSTIINANKNIHVPQLAEGLYSIKIQSGLQNYISAVIIAE